MLHLYEATACTNLMVVAKSKEAAIKTVRMYAADEISEYCKVQLVDINHEKMLAELTKAGAHIDAIFYCPHSPDDNCGCRKPLPGLLTCAAEELNIDLAGSVLIGDSEGDLEAGKAAGCKVIQVTEKHTLIDVVKEIIAV